MSEENISKLISQLKSISPDADFVARSRALIMATPRSVRGKLLFTSRTVLGRALDTGLSLALMSALIVGVLGGVGVLFRNKPVNNPTPSFNAGLTNQADAAIKDINVHISDVQYFNTEATKTSAALKAAAGKNAVSEPTPTSTNVNINNLLNQAAQ